jgi:pseudaminic acid biosynthesis-associated methylase
MTDQIKLWKSKFGDDYVDRNLPTEDNIAARTMMFTKILNTLLTPMYVPKYILEVGAGVGANLSALNDIYNHHGATINRLSAVEPNDKAAKHLDHIEGCTRIGVNAFDIDAQDHSFDLVFTSGVLIHIHPNDQMRAMKEIYRTTKKNIICIEYFSPELREIKYHNEEKALWTNDYGSLWMNNFPLQCLGWGFEWKKATGLDNVTWWSFQKAN